MRILFIGDVVGRPGRASVARWVPALRDEFQIDFVIANGENAAGGIGATPETIRQLCDSGVQAITMGNHTWRKKELVGAINAQESVIRPANYPSGVPGQGSAVFSLGDGRTIGIASVLGRVYMEPFGCPFEAAKREVDTLRRQTKVILVDVHAEATSEKAALGWYLDGTCTAVVGTHTHVQTSDERVMPKGTAFISDVGMTGPIDSAIGVDFQPVIKKFMTGIPSPFTVSNNRPAMHAVVIDADDSTGKANSIERVVREDA